MMVGLQQAALQQQQQNAAKEEEPRSFLMKRGVSWQAYCSYPPWQGTDHISHQTGSSGGHHRLKRAESLVVDISVPTEGFQTFSSNHFPPEMVSMHFHKQFSMFGSS